VVANVVVVWHPADVFDEGAEQDEAVVGVLKAGARVVGEPTRAVELQVVAVLAQLQAVLVELGAEDVAGPAGMGQQVAHGDLGGHLLVGIAGQVLADGVVQGQLVRLDQL
jgi:hypothetical protein